MRITVKIGDIEVTIDRPDFKDGGVDKNGPQIRENILKDTILPTLVEATNKAKELYKLQNPTE